MSREGRLSTAPGAEADVPSVNESRGFAARQKTASGSQIHPESHMLRFATVLVAMLTFCAGAAQAASLSNASRGEIESLMSRLEASACRFKRNGNWHTSAEARAHLQRKLDYLQRKSAVASAEQFIERAATRSSLSGQAYWIQCGSQTPQPGGEWLLGQLRQLRAASNSAAAAPR